ncbi:hypothetical protein N9392_00810 [Flavobacteriaceae bacterium]|nr:hypothetical protein [Flavobacteriaceae bacterium]
MNSSCKYFFKELIVIEQMTSMYWNNKRYTKKEIIDIKKKIEEGEL